MKTAKLITMGCKVNQYDTQSMRETLRRNGYTIADDETSQQQADLYLINTCTVTNAADQKARQAIRRAIRQHPNAKVLVTGCYAESDREAIEEIPGVTFVFGNREKADFQQYLDVLHTETSSGTRLETAPVEAPHTLNPLLAIEPVQHDAIREHARFSKGISDAGKRTRALIKVQDGCSAFCTYCIIPYVRGRMTSRPLPDIVQEAKQIAANGYKEIVITGVHLGAYGLDIGSQTTIADILEHIHPIDGIERIRFSSIEAMNFPSDLVDRMAALPKCMPHFHLPLQAGSDKVLRQMRRRYTRAEFSRLVEKLRTSFPDVGITTDVMVGFPSETDADFEESLQFVEAIGFNQLHVFRYSPRRGTPAADYADHLPPHVSAERSKAMIALGKRLGADFRKRMLGKTMHVLVEESREGTDGHLAGFTENYLRVLMDVSDSAVNRILPAKLTEMEGEFIRAEANGFHTDID
jgi:threonylcarbamoyladenosine tRNA methylthiotransferase MtaB